jgi:heme peroxidase
MSQRHGVPIRGLMSVNNSPEFEGKFGRMFHIEKKDQATFGATEADNVANLSALGTAMSAGFDAPFDGPDPEESGIPALYTYFGQFIDHDITFDPASSLQMQNDPDALIDFRSPAFDLDNVYGRGPDDQPALYNGDDTFLLGDPIFGGSDPKARDLPRNNAIIRRALIGDPRNDENSLVSQLQGLFLRFHNRMVAENPPSTPFAEIQKLVRFHYQYVILNDFLPRIVNADVYNSYKHNGRFDKSKIKFFHTKKFPFMPVEFSVAAYRLGHSMVRPGYRLNDAVLLPIFPVPSTTAPGFSQGLTGFRALIANWALDWGRFIDIDVRPYGSADDKDPNNKTRLQFAYRIDTSVVNPLSTLPPSVASNPSSLAQRNLLRGWRLGLPNGQFLAHAMGFTPLPDDKILIGKGVDKPDPGDDPKPITTINKVFAGNCPLWTYILAEAMDKQTTVSIPVTGGKQITTPQLGPVGGTLVMETFLGLMFADKSSLLTLQPDWQPAGKPNFALKDLVSFALG